MYRFAASQPENPPLSTNSSDTIALWKAPSAALSRAFPLSLAAKQKGRQIALPP